MIACYDCGALNDYWAISCWNCGYFFTDIDRFGNLGEDKYEGEELERRLEEYREQ